MQGGEIELLRQPSRCLMYVGDITALMSSRKLPISCIDRHPFRRPPNDDITAIRLREILVISSDRNRRVGLMRRKKHFKP